MPNKPPIASPGPGKLDKIPPPLYKHTAASGQQLQTSTWPGNLFWMSPEKQGIKLRKEQREYPLINCEKLYLFHSESAPWNRLSRPSIKHDMYRQKLLLTRKNNCSNVKKAVHAVAYIGLFFTGARTMRFTNICFV